MRCEVCGVWDMCVFLNPFKNLPRTVTFALALEFALAFDAEDPTCARFCCEEPKIVSTGTFQLG